MQFFVRASGSGKRIRVTDRIENKDVFEEFLDPDKMATVTVASNDGRSGNVDILKRLRADGVWEVHEQDYDVTSDEEVSVDD